MVKHPEIKKGFVLSEEVSSEARRCVGIRVWTADQGLRAAARDGGGSALRRIRLSHAHRAITALGAGP